ncbi:MAG: antibiotic biosynthesis monooxygenase [Methanobacteriaceae archaeon]|nr:antibiotic biosynthesis monooxygenase [Methanobacteriaceae archaeon]
MVYVLGRLKLESYDKWKPLFDERSAIRKESGSKEAHLFLNSDDQNEAVILFKWDSRENAQKYMESAAMLKSLKNIGAEIMSITYLEEIEKTI